MHVLAKKENGNCIFLDDNTMRCTIYNKRPLECVLYPFLLDFDKNVVNVKLDKNCPNLQTLSFDITKISLLLKDYKFPDNWIKGYESLVDY